MNMLEFTVSWILLIVTTALFLYYYYYTKKPSPDFPEGVPYVSFFKSIVGFWKALIQTQSFHDGVLAGYRAFEGYGYYGGYLVTTPFITVRDPELIKDITIKDFDHFTDHRKIFPDDMESVWNKGIASLQGQRWRDMRSTLSPAFTSSKMKTMFLLVSECCEQVVRFLEECHKKIPFTHPNMKKEGDAVVLELKEFFSRYTNDVISTTAFGISVDSLKWPRNEFYSMGQYITDIKAHRMLLLLVLPRIARIFGISIIPDKVTKFFKSLVLDTMSTREREGIVRPDMLQLLMAAKKGTLQEENSTENKHVKTKLDDDDIVAQAVLFFFAGFDTASTLPCFTCHLLAVHPDIQTRLQKEVDTTLLENGGKFTYEAVNNMKYLDMVVSETLRLYPPSPVIDRLCVRPYTLCGNPSIELRPGDFLFIPIFGLHRDPKYFPDPDRFDPERFSDENKHKINPMTYLPFGVGPRSCIGNRFALMEAKLVLAYIVSKFNLQAVEKTPKSIRLVQNGFNSTADGGFWLGFKLRRP